MINNIIGFFSDINTYKPLFPFILGIFLKIVLDLNLGKEIVKRFYWISLRGIFRKSTNKISGIYKQYWHIDGNQSYPRVCQRQSLITLKQLNNYCYGEFYAKEGKEKYYLFGEIIDRKIIGHWSDYNSRLDYFGSFELTIVNSKKIKGVWVGHSNINPVLINQHEWTFSAVVPNHKFLVPLQLKMYIKRKIKSKKTDAKSDLKQ